MDVMRPSVAVLGRSLFSGTASQCDYCCISFISHLIAIIHTFPVPVCETPYHAMLPTPSFCAANRKVVTKSYYSNELAQANANTITREENRQDCAQAYFVIRFIHTTLTIIIELRQ